MVADAARHYTSDKTFRYNGRIIRNGNACDLLDDNKHDPRCGHLFGGAVSLFFPELMQWRSQDADVMWAQYGPKTQLFLPVL